MGFNIFRQYVVEQDPPQEGDDISGLLGGEQPAAQEAPAPQQGQEQPGEDVGDLLGGEEDPEGDDEQNEKNIDNMVDQAASQDPDRQGVLRVVPGAHLVYKRETEDGTFEELWIYNVGKLQDELNIRKAVLAGTDIPVNKKFSPDGEQTFEIWSAGNAELLHVMGLPN